MKRNRFAPLSFSLSSLIALGACALSENTTGPSAPGGPSTASPGWLGVANQSEIADGTRFALGGRDATVNVTNHPTNGTVTVSVTDANGTSNSQAGATPGAGSTAENPTVGGEVGEMSTGTGSQPGGDTYRIEKVGSDLQLQRKNANGDWIDMGSPRPPKIRPVEV